MTGTALHPTSEEAIRAIRVSTVPGQRLVFVSGNFNILHPGHLRLLRFARECGDFLVVGILGGGSSGAYLAEELRLEGVQAIHWVDHAFVLRDEPTRFISALRPDLVVKGAEHEQGVNDETEVVAGYGGKLLFGSGDISFSSVDLMRQEFQEMNLTTIRKPKDYLARHGVGSERALDILERMKDLRVCVLGDTIVDEYITCDALGMSQEDPTIVVTPILQERFVGGAGIVAAHARSLGKQVHFLSVLGRDDTAGFVRESMEAFHIDFHGFEDDSRPTTLKQRFRATQKTLLRVSHLRQHDIPVAIRDRILADVKAVLGDVDLLLFADFNYGCLPQSLIQGIQTACNKRGVLMAADSQSSSQMGDVSRFKGMKLVTPTEREARLALQDFDSGLVVLADKLRAKSRAENVVITLGAEGVLIQAGLDEAKKWPTDRLPALNLAPKDPAGAGDSFLTCAAMGLAVGADIWEASYLGSVAAACQVGRLGNVPLTHVELAREVLH
ncbi:MAG: adenylyltransferase/cytidyltransferase family protein [Acidobacteria bacterium]|nr:adenylyltransferase/cytidyltransferase family protein [Acidobacteriota bacterium]